MNTPRNTSKTTAAFTNAVTRRTIEPLIVFNMKDLYYVADGAVSRAREYVECAWKEMDPLSNSFGAKRG
jgi:hypothetical protein